MAKDIFRISSGPVPSITVQVPPEQGVLVAAGAYLAGQDWPE